MVSSNKYLWILLLACLGCDESDHESSTDSTSNQMISGIEAGSEDE